jgi:hypothetical protein
MACGGSYVHIIQGILNPCCSTDSVDCDPAPLDAKQVNATADATPVAGAAAALGGFASLALPALVLAAALI